MNKVNRESLYQETIDIILDAWNNGNLVPTSPCGCFIGNLIAAKCDNLPKKSKNMVSFINIKFKYDAKWFDIVDSLGDEITEEGLRQIESTGYSLKEIIQLENLFESSCREKADELGLYTWDLYYLNKEVQFAGLKACFDLLQEIHSVDTKVHDTNIHSLEKLRDKVCV